MRTSRHCILHLGTGFPLWLGCKNFIAGIKYLNDLKSILYPVLYWLELRKALMWKTFSFCKNWDCQGDNQLQTTILCEKAEKTIQLKLHIWKMAQLSLTWNVSNPLTLPVSSKTFKTLMTNRKPVKIKYFPITLLNSLEKPDSGSNTGVYFIGSLPFASTKAFVYKPDRCSFCICGWED